ncbi:MAG: acyltransferase family protein [Lachnospiraceae bacterium]|nr:acyltransferase family protein [Lachnospiraceae bacterium]
MELSNIKTKRIAYLDMARGIGMVLVVLGHIEYLGAGWLRYVTAFHMPLFFFVSGILICKKKEEEKPFAGLIKKKLVSIMVPYVIFSLLSFLIESSRIWVKGLDEWNVVLRQLFQSCCLQGVSTLWFLPALFMGEVIFIGIRKKTPLWGTVICVCVIVMGAVVINDYEQNFARIHAVSRAYRLLHDVCSMFIRNLFCVGFLAAGYFAEIIFFEKKLKGFADVCLALVFGMIAFVSIQMSGLVDLRSMRFASAPLYVVVAVTGSMTVIFLCKCLTRLPYNPLQQIMEYYGRNSLVIMVTHMDFRVMYIAIRLLLLLTIEPIYSILFCLVIVAIVFVLEIPIIWAVNKYFPFAVGRSSKSS